MGALLTISNLIVCPLLAGGAVLLAARDQRPGLATAMVALPTLFGIVGAVAFAIAVIIHGF